MAKKTIKMNEAQLRNMIAESVKKALNEIGDTPRGQYMLGRAQQKKIDRDLGDRSIPHMSHDEADKLGDIETYAYKKNLGNDSLRKSYKQGTKEYYGGNTSRLDKEYPNEGQIDIDALFDDLEKYTNKLGFKISNGVFDGILIYGFESKLSMQAAFADISYIAGNHGISEKALHCQPLSGVKGVYEIVINVAARKHNTFYDNDEEERGNQSFLNDLSSFTS